MLSKKEVSFEHPARGMNDCDECKHYAGAGKCHIVSGLVLPEDWCNRFEIDSHSMTEVTSRTTKKEIKL
jgi:hypothetical protein